jgi:hypothetical protein
MTDLTTLLKDADPARDGIELSPAEAQAMRRAMLAAGPESVGLVHVWRHPLALAAAAALVFGVSGAISNRRAPAAVAESPDARLPALDGGSSGERRQLQFATPGGTRIIWIFDQNLRFQESMP